MHAGGVGSSVSGAFEVSSSAESYGIGVSVSRSSKDAFGSQDIMMRLVVYSSV